jgi:hypothetical protein
MKISADIHPTKKVQSISVPEYIAEHTGIQGFVFSRKIILDDLPYKYTVPKTSENLNFAIKAGKKGATIAKETLGGPAVGENYISIKIANHHPKGGSNADKFYLQFGKSEKFIRLWGVSGGDHRFPAGESITWDMNVGSTDPHNWIESVPTNAWDKLRLVNKAEEGILLENIKIVHSSIPILNWPDPGNAVWLHGVLGGKNGSIALDEQILYKKLASIQPELHEVPQLYWAVMELGKTDGTKYGTTHSWSTEFTSWCLRKAGWRDIPRPASLSDDLRTTEMEHYFAGKNRLFTVKQLERGEYKLHPGDFLCFENHSALFVHYENDGRAPNDPKKRFVAIDGNWGSKVSFSFGSRREIRDLISVGSTS